MASDRSIRRYRRWYAHLLLLYPGPYRERFGEPMEQTFADLCLEHRDASRGLHAFLVRTFIETSAGIMRENMTHFIRDMKLIRWVVATAVLLLVPLLAMLFQRVLDPVGNADEVAWGPLDFVLAGVLVLGTGLMFELATRQAGHIAQRVAAGIAVGAALLLVWISLAVGIIGSEDNPANLMYIGVLAVGLIGAYLARIQPGGMARALFATAFAQAMVAVIALVAGLPATLPLDAFFVALWVASGLLFRHASVAPSPSR